jgi:hypothetical protein
VFSVLNLTYSGATSAIVPTAHDAEPSNPPVADFQSDTFLQEFLGAWSNGRGGDAKASKTQHEEHEESRRFTEKQGNEVRQVRLLPHDRGDFKTI